MYNVPYGDTQQLNLDWFIKRWKEFYAEWEAAEAGIDGALDAEVQKVENAMQDLYAARDAAAASASAAAQSANGASTSAATASNAATAAANSATLANSKAAAAGLSEANAAQSANSASNSASAAAGSASNAATSETNAAQSANSASNSASAAAGSARNAATSETNAAASAADAEESAQRAEDAAASGGGVVKSVENVPIASVDDALNENAVELVVDVDPVQAGTGDPTPVNVRPITRWTGANVTRTGKNLWNEDYTEIDTTIKYKPIFVGNGIFTLSTSQAIELVGVANLFLLSGNVSAGASSPTNGVWLGHPITVASVSGYVTIAYRHYTGTTSPTTWQTQLEVGSSASPYEQYTGATYPVTFPTEAGTVYSGELDITNKKLYIDTFRKINSLTWEYSTQYNRFASASVKNTIKKPESTATVLNKLLCSCYTARAAINTGSQPINYTIGVNTLGEILIRDENYTSVSDWLNAVGNEIIVYPLAIPLEYDITSEAVQLLLGYNNIWANTGNVNLLRYYTDSKGYIDAQNALVKAIIAKELDDMIADTALTVNDFCIVNNTLYRITAPIASGATLTPNTNCTATTVSEILKTLLT